MSNKKGLLDHMLGFWGYQRITGAAATTRDGFTHGDKYDVPFGRMEWDRTLHTHNIQALNKMCWRAYNTNALFWGAVELSVRMIVGNDVQVRANGLNSDDPQKQEKAKKLQAALDRFWLSPANNMPMTVPEFTRDLLLFGEVLPVPIVDIMSGFTELGFLPPESIQKLVRHPLNTRRILAVVVKTNEGNEQILPIVQIDRSGSSRAQQSNYSTATNSTTGRLTGSVLYWSINRALTSIRGHGDFVQAIKPAESALRVVNSVGDRTEINNRIVGEILFPTNWTVDQINAAMDPSDKDHYINPPQLDESGPKMFAHTKDIEYKIHAPNIGAAESGETFKMIKAVFLAAVGGMPEFWIFGQGDNSNRATAQETKDPSLYYLSNRQTMVRRCIRECVDFAIDQEAIFTNQLEGLTPEELRDYTELLPEINIENLNESFDLLTKELDAIYSAKTGGDLDGEQSREMTRLAMEKHGMSVPKPAPVKPIVPPVKPPTEPIEQ